MWLLDVNMPNPLTAFLGELGIQAATATDRGWGTLTNGRLVEAAVREGFVCLLTRDRLFGDSAAQALHKFPQFAVVLIGLPQLKAPQFLQSFQTAWESSPIKPVSGKMIHWPPTPVLPHKGGGKK
jgi:uncharacterized protein DUF5615